ncbi:MAG: N-acetyltransferase [Pseudomonadota bacterium]
MQQPCDRKLISASGQSDQMPEVKEMNVAPNTLIVTEKPEDYLAVEKLAEDAFGPGRFTRTAFRLREGVPREPDLSFVTWMGDMPIAAVKLTKIWVGDKEALLLGPLVVSKEYKSRGYGAQLMETAVNAAKSAGHDCIILVGDLPYYQRFGFEIVKRGTITLPGPVDPQRLLICPLKDGAAENMSGTARPYC